MIFVQVVVFGIIMYFMTNLDVNVSKFFIFELFIFVTTICITALYRMFAALSPTIDDAVRFSGLGKQFLVPKMMALQTTSGGCLDNGDTWLLEVDLILRHSSCHKKGGLHCVPFTPDLLIRIVSLTRGS
jgi:hypothetical protein